eukprot:6212938-Pleurochrysis_carterae.AAC.12
MDAGLCQQMQAIAAVRPKLTSSAPQPNNLVLTLSMAAERLRKNSYKLGVVVNITAIISS